MGLFSYLKNFLRLKIYGPLRINHHASFYSSHSQFGEDMVLRALFGHKKDGIFIDLGAHHPIYYSNTYHFYQRGWRGINIDATPGSMTLFNQFRPQDKNIEACIDNEDGKDLTFYQFVQSAYNTIDPKMAEEAKKKGHEIINEHKLKTKSIFGILKESGFENKEIDFFNIDIEGVDKIILENNDWSKFKPKVIAFEDHQFDIKNIENSETLNLLLNQGYKFKGLCGPTIIVGL